ncbi:hypothetical protein niasHT_033503 [Heterodera trifolii]|uniref:EGF-like domain-containing protein n=1 Tax=Heterodera trifolii TaxID=157864 RepID=A0ABD2J693_9BILA
MIETLEADQRAFFVNQTGDAEFLGYSGKTALHFAASCNNVAMIELLVRHGANREATDQQGRTPLFLAVELGQYDSTEALLQLHADRTKANSADTKIIPELISRPGHGEFMKLFKKYPEQQHFQQMGRPCSSGTANVQQRHNGCEVKIGTKRQRSTCAKRSNGTDEQSDFIGAEVAKKAALSRPYEQFELQKPSQIVGTNVASTSATSSVVIISPLPPQNMLTPPNSDQSVYSTSSPSPNKTSRTSSNSISCNASQQLVVRPLAVNVGNRYAQQPQNHQQQCQEFCTFEAKKGNGENECGLGELETDGRRKGESKWAEDKLCIKVKCEEKGNDTKFAFCLQQCENFCQSSTEVCLNGFCMNDQNGSQCQTGWTRQRCQEDIDECQLRDKLCQNGGKCVNTGGDCVHDAHEPDPTADDQPKLLLGELFLAVALHPSTLFNDTALFRQFLVALSAHLRASLALAIDLYDKKPKLFEWRSDKGIGKRIELPPEVNATALFNVRYDEEGEAGKRSKRKAEEFT